VGEGLLHVWPVTRSVTRLLTSDVSVVPLRLRRNAELRFVGHSATGRDTWDTVAGSKPKIFPPFGRPSVRSLLADHELDRHSLIPGA
jgi:hypothetical protein